MSTKVFKELLLVEDVEFGFEASEQERTGTQLNAVHLPYTTLITVKAALDNRHTIDASNTAYAYKAGDPLQTFKAAVAIAADDVIRKDTFDAADALKANKTSVLMRDNSLNNEGYIPQFQYDPATKGYADGILASKFTGAITVQFKAYSIVDGVTPVTVTVTGGVVTGVV